MNKDTSRFLAWLDEDAEQFVFQTYDEQGTGRSGNIYNQRAFTSPLTSLNKNGFGVSVTVNETDGGRKASDVTRVRAIWFDDDTGAIDPRSFALAPSVIVRTSSKKINDRVRNCHHFYWLLSDGWLADESGVADFRAVMNGMVELGCDPQCIDISRAMRLPGSYHCKGDPFLTHVLSPSGEGAPVRYSRAQLVAAFATEKIAYLKRASPTTDASCDIEEMKSALARIDPDSRDHWIRVGMGLKRDACLVGGDDAAYQLWDDWSKGSLAKYDRRELARQWRSFADRPDGIGLGTVHYLAGHRSEPELTSIVIPSAPASSSNRSNLAEVTLASLRATFRDWGHSPSPVQMEALEDLANRLAMLADGTCPEAYYLSSLDPGIGKTTCLKLFLKAMLASPAHRGVAALVCVGRLAEIGTYVHDMNLADEDYAVLVADSCENTRLNSLGNPNRDRARVLFSTQQLLESRTKRKGSFSAVSEFHYLGEPRGVRVWDEAILPARPMTIDVTTIEGLTEVARRNPILLKALDGLIADIKEAPSSGVVSIPDFEAEGVSLDEALWLFEDEKKQKSDVIRDLFLLSASTVAVVRDGRDRCMIHYEETLPQDLKPVVVCDASGRIRQTYPHWSEGRQDLAMLLQASKDYSDLTVHVWPRAGSKSAWAVSASANDMLKAIVEVVNDRPEEEFLIVHHKASGSKRSVDVPELIRREAVNPQRLHFTHWGGSEISATNAFKDVPNVILAGSLFLPNVAYEALGRLSRALPSSASLEKKHRREIEMGEHAHLILQSVCRGRVRQAIGGKCGKADVWIIASADSGIPSMLDQRIIFPGSKVVPWEPSGIAAPVTKVSEAIDALTAWAKGTDRRIAVPELRTKIGETDKGNFHKLVLGQPSFKNAVDRLGLRLVKGVGRNPSYLERKSMLELPY